MDKMDRASTTMHRKAEDAMRYKDWLTVYPPHPYTPVVHQTEVIDTCGGCHHTPCSCAPRTACDIAALKHQCTHASADGCEHCAREKTVYLLPPSLQGRNKNPLSKSYEFGTLN